MQRIGLVIVAFLCAFALRVSAMDQGSTVNVQCLPGMAGVADSPGTVIFRVAGREIEVLDRFLTNPFFAESVLVGMCTKGRDGGPSLYRPEKRIYNVFEVSATDFDVFMVPLLTAHNPPDFSFLENFSREERRRAFALYRRFHIFLPANVTDTDQRANGRDFNEWRRTCLREIEPADVYTLKSLLKYGFPNKADPQGRSLLHYAAYYDCADIARELVLTHGADVHSMAASLEGWRYGGWSGKGDERAFTSGDARGSAMYVAIARGHVAVARVLYATGLFCGDSLVCQRDWTLAKISARFGLSFKDILGDSATGP